LVIERVNKMEKAERTTDGAARLWSNGLALKMSYEFLPF
jgi:hypothetical protein